MKSQLVNEYSRIQKDGHFIIQISLIIIVKSIMDKQIAGHLLNFFKQIINRQTTLLSLRQSLEKCKQFSPSLLFRQISADDTSISISAMSNYVQYSHSCNDRELYEIFQKFDHQRQGRISEIDFCQQISIKGRKIKKKNKEKLSFQGEKIFNSYLKTLINSCRVQDIWRKQLLLPIYRLFQALDYSKQGIIGPNELICFFRNQKQPISCSNIQLLFRAILKDHHRQINLEVFCETINPMEFGGYENYKQEQEYIHKTIIQKQQIEYVEAIEKQKHYCKQKNNQMVVLSVLEQAATTRQKDIQNRIRDELELYSKLKYNTHRKYHSNSSYEGFLHFQKENHQRNLIKEQMLIERALQKERKYVQKLKHVDVVREVQAFQRSRRQRAPLRQIDDIRNKNQVLRKNNDQLETLIKKHAMERRINSSILSLI